jgi:hypothetical protein
LSSGSSGIESTQSGFPDAKRSALTAARGSVVVVAAARDWQAAAHANPASNSGSPRMRRF